MLLSNLLDKKLIKLNLVSQEKDGVLQELVELLSCSGVLKNKKAFLRSIKEREALGTTAIGNGIAIPYAKDDEIDGFSLAFAISREGVDFKAIDKEKVHLFFILATPGQEIGMHLKILARITRLLKDKHTKDCLMEAATEKEVLEIIKKAESEGIFESSRNKK